MSNHRTATRLFHWLDSPEWNIAIFSFLLSFVWEIQQMPLYQVPPEHSCFVMIRYCTLATVGDVGIMLAAFWLVAALSKTRYWVQQPTWRQIGVFTLLGVLITVIFEDLATRWLGIWTYADFMPVIPLIGTGLSPLLMWILLPPLTIWFVKRQSLPAN